MNEKWTTAQRMVDQGASNEAILEHMHDNYGSGISLSKLAQWRATSEDRRKRIGFEQRRDLVREVLLAGKSGYAAQKECKRRFGSGIGHETVKAVKAEIAAQRANGELPEAFPEDEPEVEAAEARDDRAIIPVDLPPEMMEAEDAPTTDLVVTPPPEPNGTLNNFKAIQQWMVKHNAESVNLTADGKLSVLARHEFDLGGSHE